ncbi:MAG: hypothetical protein ABUS57_16655 [Pseudomonadota bacterium]
MTLQECQAPIDRQIVAAIIHATPESWKAVQMTAERDEADANERMSISFLSLDGHTEPVAPTDEIYAALYALSDCFRKHGTIWDGVKYVVREDAAGS